MGLVSSQIVVLSQCLAQVVVAPVSPLPAQPTPATEVSLPPPPDSSRTLEAPARTPGVTAPVPQTAAPPIQAPAVTPASQPEVPPPQAPAVTTPAPRPSVPPSMDPMATPTTCPTCPEIPVWNAPPPTRTGDALIVTGSGLLTVGIPTTIVGLGFSFDIPIFAAIWVLPSLIFTGAGAGMLVGGLRMRKNYRQWMVDHRANPPANGVGLMTGGGLLLGGSVIPLGFAIAFSSVSEGGVEPITLTTFLGSVVTGGLMLGYGIKRRQAYLRWRPHHAFARNLQVAPLTLRRGGGLMIHTRF